MLHGILGSGANLRGISQRLVQADPSLLAVLVDLRMHGRSQGFAAPHTVAACAQDLLRLSDQLPCPVSQVVGHSFGGKVALAFHAHRPDLERVALLDSAPGARTHPVGSEQTFSILALLDELPASFARKEDFLERVMRAGHSRMIAEWLAMNLERHGSEFRLRLDVSAVRAMVGDYFRLDLWAVIERSTARLDVLVGGRSGVWQPEDIQRFEALAAEQPGKRKLHVLAKAGHWLHVDDMEGLTAALTDQSAATP
jgi:pimeloyl-ACP methyl ester carboxylesterase